MTYKLNPEIRKIISPVVLIFPNGDKQEFEDGKAATEAVFVHKYTITAIRVVNERIEVKLTELKAPNMNWNPLAFLMSRAGIPR